MIRGMGSGMVHFQVIQVREKLSLINEIMF